VCDKCPTKILKLKCDASNKQKDDDNDSDSDETEQFAKITAMQSLNESFQLIGGSPTKKKRLDEGKYPTSKMKRIEKAVKRRILNIPVNVNSNAVSPLPDAEILKQLKEKFQDSMTSKSLKVTISTILPKSWSIWKVQDVCPSVSNYMIRKAKQLVMEQGIMSSPNLKPQLLLKL
jgi:hypothetical protein